MARDDAKAVHDTEALRPRYLSGEAARFPLRAGKAVAETPPVRSVMLGGAMATWKRLLQRARSYAEQAVPDDVRAAGRRVVERVRDVVAPATPEPVASAPEPEPPPRAAAPEPTRVDPEEVLRRVKAKAEHGLKPEDTVVVVYTTADEADSTREIVRCFEGIDTTVRVMDLDREPPQTKRQLAKLTDVMVPPYVYINGRYWGAQYEIVALLATGDLPAVVAHRLDEIGPEARRIGKIHDSYSDAITTDNILMRLRLGHILCVDDLDAWYEQDKDGTEHFFYQGGECPVAQMPEVAADIQKRVDAGEIEAQWRLDTLVHVH
jgi:hypothetical protein